MTFFYGYYDQYHYSKIYVNVNMIVGYDRLINSSKQKLYNLF